MLYPKLKEIPTSRELIDVFKGYNHNLRIGEGEFYDMKNLSSDNFPVLSPRQQRAVYLGNNDVVPLNPQGMVAKDALCYVDGNTLYINKYPITDTKMQLTVDNKPKTLISMGAYIIIMPDKKYINTKDFNDCGNIEATKTTDGEVSFTLCKVDGVAYEEYDIGPNPPSDPATKPLWLDTSETPHQLKQYSTSSETWSAIATTYIKITATGIGQPFEVNDTVTISGVTNLTDLNGSMTIWAKGDNYIVVTGIADRLESQTTPITIKRTMPEMDFIIEAGNRLWGCKYGPTANGVVNEIYASKLGDFKNWNCFMGISTDSYAVSVGTDGEFTGAITHLGYPLFFKENYIHKIYGNYPANFQVQTTACRGVQQGCNRSLAIVNEVLYYKSRTGICAYDGSLPVEVSSVLGDKVYGNAVAGALGNKYYVSMADSSDMWHLFVYDTAKGMWHKEDGVQATDFCNCRGDLYFIDYHYNQIKNIKGTDGTRESDPIIWEAVTGIIGTDNPDKKYLSRMDVRMSLQMGSKVSFYIEYDSSGEWEYLFAMDGVNLKSFSVPIKPQRCDHMRLKIIGRGDAKIFSICKTIEQGSDV